MSRVRVILLLGILLTVFLPRVVDSAEAQPKKLRVVTTIFPLYCFASGVIGTNGQVQNLLPANVGPHDYQLSPSDVRKLRDADIIIVNGLGLDDWATKALNRSRGKGPRILNVGALLNKTNLIDTHTDLAVEGKHDHGHDHHHGPINPHVWLDPQLALQCVGIISNAVVPMNPAFKQSAQSYAERLQRLDSDLQSRLAHVRGKPFITQHDAFPYFVRRYQLNQVGVVEPTPDVSPSPRYLRDLLKVIREKKVGVIFSDPRASTRLVRQVAKDANIRTADLDTLESGKLDANGYEEGMRRNSATLTRELR